MDGLTKEEKSRLNPQDLEDLKEIQALQELAEVQIKQKDAIEKENDDLHGSDLPFERKKFDEKKWYLDIRRQTNSGDLRLNIFVPPYDIKQI